MNKQIVLLLQSIDYKTRIDIVVGTEHIHGILLILMWIEIVLVLTVPLIISCMKYKVTTNIFHV